MAFEYLFKNNKKNGLYTIIHTKKSQNKMINEKRLLTKHQLCLPLIVPGI